MCGIAGYVNIQPRRAAEPEIVDLMCRSLVHRGPDDQGIFVHGHVALGMRRLSIIDLETGHQPISNETKRIWVVLNGEIYNYRELAESLKARGHALATASDTEVIVHLYEELGEDCIHKLRGMFAFALWDEDTGRLLIARDRLGVKPLYYMWNGRQLIFGSELKAVLAHPEVERALDLQGLLYYLRYSYIPDPLTIFQGISKLPPGHFLSVTGTALEVKRYWDAAVSPAIKPTCDSEEEAIERLEEHLKESVRLRLVSDVPLGAFLSGGLDSSLVVALMSRQMARPVTTFSIGFEEKTYNELPYARAVARHLDTEHHEFVVGPQSCTLVEQLVRHFDEPFGDPSAIATYCLSKLAAQHVTVALSGDGGDELFVGYDRYRIDLDRSRYDRWPMFAKRALSITSDLLPKGWIGKNLLHVLSLAPRDRYLQSISYLGPTELKDLIMPNLRNTVEDCSADIIMLRHFQEVSQLPWLTQLQYLDTKTYLPGDVMTKVDRMSMAHSLEAREPLLDHVLVEFVARLPGEMKFRHGVSKYLLKKVAERYLPSENIVRKKQGFGVPLEYWFQKELKEFMHDVLLGPRAANRGLFNTREVERLVHTYESGRHELASLLWMLVVLETWFANYLDSAPSLSEATNSRRISMVSSALY